MNNRLVNILVNRDGVTEEEAVSMINDCMEALLTCDPFESDEVIQDMLGLEPDYLDEIMDFGCGIH